MMPMYMNSSQPGQMRPQGCYHQGFGNYPHQVDASSPASCENWQTPSPCYGSCIHGNFPSYTPYWPPCYPPQVPPHHTCCVNHSGFHPHAPYYIHQSFPVGYQPGYYESEKDVTGKHRCAKCSPQMCYPKNDRSVVIEEHEPEIEKGDHGEAVSHVRSTNCPYPILWIPHENARNQEHRSYDRPPVESKVPESTKVVRKGDSKSWTGCSPFDENTVKSLIQDPDWKKMQNGKTVELPFDISNLKSLLRGQEGKDVQIQKNKEPGEHQYPIFWIPSHGKQEDVEASEKREHSNERRTLKSSSSDHLNEGQITQGNKGNFESNVLSDAEERGLVRNIPLKKHIQEPRNIPVKVLENVSKPAEPTKRTAKTELVENTEKEQRLSPSKASRLPPVCLRVDPLPKKKNGGLKSLSSPRRNEQTLTSEETKVTSPMSFKKVETKTVPETCNVKCEEANKEKKMSEGCPSSTGTEKGLVESITNLHAGANCEIVKPCEAKEHKEEPARKTLREDEAARVIQSRYRGYDVRRWEPIKKLKEIAHVRKQMADVKKRIQALGVSSTDQQTEGKEIVILGEMVMSLLLKLDSVQGLHPSIRDFRKSLARELSDMQENLDSLKKSAVEKGEVVEQVEITSQSSECPVNMELNQIIGEEKMVPESNAEKVLPPFPEEYPMSLKNTTDEQLSGEAEEVTGLSETLATEPEPAVESGISEEDSTSPGKSKAVETVLPLPVNPSSAIGNELLVTNIEEDVVEKLEEPPHELPQVVETTGGPGCEGPENATEVSETVANASEKNEDRKGDDDTVLPSEKNIELSELPFGVVNYETQLHSQDLSSSTWQAEKNEMDPETESQEEVNVDHSCDHSKGIGQETAAPHEEIEQHPETGVKEHEMLEETKKLMEENQRFKETVETLVKAGREQLEVISKLTCRVKSLEKKMLQKKRTHVGRRKPICGKYATKPMSSTVL